MDSQLLQAWNFTHPVGAPVQAKLPAGSNDPRSNPLPTKTRSAAYFLNKGIPVVMVSGISTPVPLSDITDVPTGPKFPVVLTTYAFDEPHLQAIRNAVAAINAEGVDLHIEQEEADGDGAWWVTISASSANRVFHLGARLGKWLAEEKGAQGS